MNEIFAEQLNETLLQNMEQLELFRPLLLTIKQTKNSFTKELIHKIDCNADEKLPVKNLIDLVDFIGIFPPKIDLVHMEQSVKDKMLPYIEDACKTVRFIIPRLLTYSLVKLLLQNNSEESGITRRYLFTDQINIYKIEIKISYFRTKCTDSVKKFKTIYCIVGSKSTINTEQIDFPSLAQFYQRQLTAHGIDKETLSHLYIELKDVYYRIQNPNMPFPLH